MTTKMLLMLSLYKLLDAHPLCLDSTFPSNTKQNQLEFCTEIKSNNNKDGSCCDRQHELRVKRESYDIYSMSDSCKKYHRQVACGECHPYADHLFSEGTGKIGMSKDFCNSYYDACKSDLKMPSDFCDKYTTSSYYAYPFDPNFKASSNLEPYFYNLKGKMPTQMIGMYMRPDARQWWIVNQRGQIYQVDNDRSATSLKKVFDLQSRVIQGGQNGLGEMGLLGLAFAPNFKESRVFYINYMDNGKNSIISKFKYDYQSLDNTNNSERNLITFNQPYENHNGGTLLFQPKDYKYPFGRTFYDLFISTGDGGSADDPNNNAQNIGSRLGKILRLRVGTDYDDNGYTNPEGNLQNEVYAYGLRNPWKCSFDMDKIDPPRLYCGDVGQNKVEEVVLIEKGGNYGWRNYEGSRYNKGDKISYKKPIYEYCHSGVSGSSCDGKPFQGESVIGGFIYRGNKQSWAYSGNYIFADYQQGSVLRLYNDNGAWKGSTIVRNTGFRISSLAQDTNGEVYIIKYGEGANIYTVPSPSQASKYDDHSIIQSDYKCPNNGIVSATVCCDSKCGSCSGFGCNLRPGGKNNCCASDIKMTAKLCSISNDSPCVINYRRTLFLEENEEDI